MNIIKVWETEEDRKKGESFIYNPNSKDPISEANKLYSLMDYACVEVIYCSDVNKDEDVLFHISSDVPKGKFDIF